MARDRVVIIGAGIGGLSSAVELAVRGCEVTVVEQAARPGGKLREVEVAGAAIDAGPTVFTMRWVFDALFEAAGERLDSHLTLRPAETLARHSWADGGRFDLFADIERSADAVGAFAGPAEARRFTAFCARARRIYGVLEAPFIRAQKPGLPGLTLAIGLDRPGDQWSIMPYRSMWAELGGYFHDPRLRQLFGRYATYCGASPFRAPATMMLIAHVEQSGVWTVDGGMARIPEALERVAAGQGARFRYGEAVREITAAGGRATGVALASGERIEADAVVVNADPAAVATGRFGPAVARAVPGQAPRDRSLSAVTFAVHAETGGEPLLRHNVFFSADYPAEFRALAAGRLADAPTVYVCAQDRGAANAAHAGPERLLAIVNAPARGDAAPLTHQEIAECQTATFALLDSCGLKLRPTRDQVLTTTPADFERLFPATGGALYGRAGHGWDSAFRRPGARTRIPNLYLAGGATHPGAGVPMAALSGRLAAQALMADRASTRRSSRAATPGGTSTRSATTAATV
jgi:1-hydroxycarotenoid 3,4-desaturase